MKSYIVRIAVVALCVLAACASNASHAPSPSNEDARLTVNDSLRARLLLAGQLVARDVFRTARDTAPVCVSFGDASGARYRLSTDELHAMADSQRRFIPRVGCPRTYTSMFVHVDSLGRVVDQPPKGYVDPYHLTMMLPEPATLAAGEIEVLVEQGTVTRQFICKRPNASSTSTLECRLANRWVA
ncbi:MAG TPA: hypothetical protein VGM50_03180 [Gemmatimonadaceae bacterium]